MDDKACCCPSRPMVRVLMPATSTRPYRVDLLLCGHHFRLSQWELAAAGAIARVLPGRRAEDAPALALLLARGSGPKFRPEVPARGSGPRFRPGTNGPPGRLAAMAFGPSDPGLSLPG